MQTYQNLLKLILVSADVLHLRHWFKSRSYSEHTLLQEAYNALRDGADKVAEHLTGLDKEGENVMAPLNVNVAKYYIGMDTASPLEIINTARRAYETIRSANRSDNTLCSIIDGIDETIVSVVYKLKIEYKKISAKRKTASKKLSASLKTTLKASTIKDALKVVNTALKGTPYRFDKASEIVTSGGDLIVVSYQGNRTKKFVDDVLDRLERELPDGWVAYLEDIDDDLAILHIEKE